MKNTLYTPVLLMKAKEEIKLIHTRSCFFNIKELDKEKEFKKFIKLLVKLKTTNVVKIASTYDHELITKLCFYIHTNVFNVNCENLFVVLYNLANDSDWEIIFSEWQNHYINEEVKKFIANSYNNSKEFKKFIDNSKISNFDLSWLQEKKIIEYLCESFGNVGSENVFGNILIKHAVLNGTQLYLTCLKYFLLYCKREAYLNTDTRDILTSYHGYNENEKIKFIHNFVSKLYIEDLDNQESMYEAIKNSTSIKIKLEEYLKEKGTFAKYNQWLERMKLMLAFDGDRDRFDFWIQYQKGNKIIDTNKDTLYIDFGNYVITEFKGKAAGPSYLFEKSFFDYTVYSKMRYMNKQNFQRYLYSLSVNNEKGLKSRLVHNTTQFNTRHWWADFSYTLSRYGINKSQN